MPKSAAQPDAEITLAEFGKNSREVVRVRRTEYEGRALLDVRTWYPDLVTGEMRPGKGLALRVEQLDDLRQALSTAASVLETL